MKTGVSLHGRLLLLSVACLEKFIQSLVNLKAPALSRGLIYGTFYFKT